MRCKNDFLSSHNLSSFKNSNNGCNCWIWSCLCAQKATIRWLFVLAQFPLIFNSWSWTS